MGHDKLRRHNRICSMAETNEVFSFSEYADAAQYFLIIDEEEILEPLRRYENEEGYWSKSVASSLRGLHSIMSAASLPYRLISGEINQELFNRHRTASQIRNLVNPYDKNDPNKDLSGAELSAKSDEEAVKKTIEYLNSEEGVVFRYRRLTEEINRRIKQPHVAMASHELLVQAVIGIWSVFESFSRDIIILSVNHNPKLASSILSAPELKDYFGKQQINVEVLQGHNFDLSRSMGSILFENRRLDSFTHIKHLMKSIFNSSDLQARLGPELWLINQRRNLFVHKRGIVDQDYAEKTNDQLELGDNLRVDARYVYESVICVRNAIKVVCSCAKTMASGAD